MRFVTLRAYFLDNQGNIIDTSEFIASSGTLFPNARSQFSKLGPDDNRIERVSIEMIDYRKH